VGSFFFLWVMYRSGWKICGPPDAEDLVRWGDLFCDFMNPLCRWWSQRSGGCKTWWGFFTGSSVWGSFAVL